MSYSILKTEHFVEAIHYSTGVLKQNYYLSQVITNSRRNKLFLPLICKRLGCPVGPVTSVQYVTTTCWISPLSPSILCRSHFVNQAKVAKCNFK